MAKGAANLVLAAALGIVLGWPALATIMTAVWGEPGSPSGVGLMTPPSSEFGGAGVARPLRLAVETIRLVAATGALAMPVGLPLAFVLFRTDAFGRRVTTGLLALSAFVPLPLLATAWLGAFGNAGRARLFGLSPWLVGWQGAAFLHAVAALPWVVLLAGVGLRTVEPELEESALLDMTAWRVVLRVTFRRGLGAVAASALAVAVLTAGDMTVTDLLQVRTYAEEAYFQYTLDNGPAAAAATALPPLIVLGGLIVVGARMLLAADPARLASASAKARVWTLGRWRKAIGAVCFAFVGALVALPLGSLVWHAGRVGSGRRVGPPRWSLSGLRGTLIYAWDDASEPLIASVWLAAVGASLAVVLAWSLAWVCRKPGVWRGVTAGSVALALAAPGPVAGMALVFAYRSVPIVYDTAAKLVLAGVLRTFPYALLILWPAVRAIPGEYLDAAAIDGFGAWGVIRRVAVRMTLGAIIAAWGVAFVLALGELPASNLLTPPGLTPLSVVIWGMLHSGVESRLAGIVLIMLAAVAAAGTLAALALGRLSRDEPSENP